MSDEMTTVTNGYAEHVSQCQARWEAALDAENFDAALIHAGSQVYSFLDDYHYPFRPNPHFIQWLPLTRHHDSVLLVRPGEKPKLFYYQPVDYWYLAPTDPETWWADRFELEIVRKPDDWLSVPIPASTAFIGDAPSLEARANGSLNPPRLVNRIHLGRTVKTPYEVACIAASNRLAASAHRAAERAFRDGRSEYEIHHAYLNACRLVDHQLPYGNIVALNEHGAVLHYQDQERVAPGDIRSFLIDAGATLQGYCSDITRTYSSADDEFSEMISDMDTMQQGLCADMRAGADYRDLHVDTHLRISAILREHGVISVSPDLAVESGLSSVFFPHGLGHYIGIQTHDVAGLIADETGTEIPRPAGHPFLRLTRRLEPGNVVTVEPGFYFIDTLLAAWKDGGNASMVNWDRVESLRRFGGIRIEDDVLVTDGDPVNLSREAFARI